MYDEYMANTTRDESDRKHEWVGLHRMRCVIMAFKDGKVTDAEIKACRLAVHNTTHLDIDYPDPKPMDICKVPKEYPYPPEYKKSGVRETPSCGKRESGCQSM